MKFRHIAIALTLLACAGCAGCAPGLYLNLPPSSESTLTGAAGDGVADDTAAFERALAAAAPGATVRVPPGRYRLTRPLTLSDVALVGRPGGGWNVDSMPLPTLLVGQTDGPALRLNSGGSVHGLAVAADAKDRFTPRPPAIEIAGQAALSGIRVQYPYDGIVCSPDAENGRLNIEDVFIVSPGRDGLVVTGTHDIPTLRNVEVWCNLGFSEGAGFRFGQNDELHGSRLFAFQCKVGFAFAPDPAAEKRGERAGTYGTLVDCATDACPRGWTVAGWAKLNVIGGDFWNHQAGLTIDSPDADVKVVGADLQSNGEPAVVATRAGTLVLSGCTFRGAANTTRPYVEVNAARSLVVSGCDFGAPRPGLRVGAGVGAAAVAGNVFRGPRGVAVDAAAGKGVELGSNSAVTPGP